MSAIDEIAAERRRQIEVEGWTPQHDDEHEAGAMLRAAVIYLWHGTEKAAPLRDGVPVSWPWAAEWWKPKDRRSNLIRAGALCLAERDRIERSQNARVIHEAHTHGGGRIVTPPYVGHVLQKLDIVLRELDALASGDA